MPKSPIILGLETSCDETAAAVVAGGRDILSNVIATQHDLHAMYAGVVPEIASRAHLERLLPVLESALAEAGVTVADLDAIAVGHRPGLIGSLLVGVSAAKTLAWTQGLPLVGIDHVHAHLYSGLLADRVDPTWPALGLVVSGGHTSLYRIDEPFAVVRLGATIDDAMGEAFDKAATILDLGYPGGPNVDAWARRGDDRAHDFPVAALGPDRLDFSFSGLKTSLLYAVRGQPRPVDGRTVFPKDATNHSDQARADFAASFERAAVRAVERNLERALDRDPARTLLAGGGVTANTRLRAMLEAFASRHGLELRLPPPALCVDNGAMIAGLAAVRLAEGATSDLSLSAATQGG